MKSKLLTVGVFACLLLVKSAYATNQYYLPHFVNGNFGLVYKTSFILFNNSDTPVTVTLKLTDNNGSPLTANITGLGNDSQFNITLDAGATKIYQSDGVGSGQGAATVTASGPIGVSAVFTVSDPGTANFVSESGIGASDPLTDFILPIDSTGSALTGLALYNPGTSDATLTLTLFGTDGTTPSGGTMTVTLKAGNHTAAFTSQLFPSITNFKGSMRVQNPTAISALVLRMYQTSTTTSFTSLPVVSKSSNKTTLNLAHIANGNYGPISFKTSFLIFNLSQSAASVTLTMMDDGGSPMPVTIPDSGASGGDTGSSFSLVLPANGSLFLQTNGTGSGSSGAAMVTSNQPIGASAIFTVLNSQTSQFQTEAGVGDSSVLTSSTLPVDITGNSDTGLAFFNPGTSSVNATFKLLDANDIISGTTTRTIAAKGHFAGFVSGLFSVSNFRGSLAVTTSGGGIASTVLRQYQFNDVAYYTTLPTASGTPTGKTSVSPLLSRTETGITPPTTKNVTLPNGFLISGTVSGGKAARIIASSGSTFYVGVADPVTGKYVVVVPAAGIYQLTAFYAPSQADTVLLTGANLATVQVSENTTRDLTLPSVSLFNVSGAVAGLSALPAGTNTSIVFTANDNTMQGTFPVDGNGNFQGTLPSGTYTATLERSTIQLSILQTQLLAALYNVGSLTVSGAAASANYTLPSISTLTGTINGLTLGSSFVTLVTATDTSAPTPTTLVCCAQPGTSSARASLLNNQYQMVLARGRSYSLGVSTLMQGQTTLSGTVALSPTTLNLSGDSATLDFTFPALPSTSTITGRVTDTSGNGVANVAISATSQSITGASNVQFSGLATTDSSGNYSLTVLDGTNYTVIYFPPPPQP